MRTVLVSILVARPKISDRAILPDRRDGGQRNDIILGGNASLIIYAFFGCALRADLES
jgi:hypothetical protein